MRQNLSDVDGRGARRDGSARAGRHTRLRVVVLAALVGACGRAPAADGRVDSARVDSISFGPDSMGLQPTRVSIVPSHARMDLTENSGAAMSARQPGVFFTINDSGNEPVLFAMDTAGADRGAWRIRGATDVDWESVSMGPCAGGGPAAACVYIGDTGDNLARHRVQTVYRVREPDARSGMDSLAAESLAYVYPDSPHDVEAMYVAPTGDMFFITKRVLKNANGRLRPALVFHLPPSAWTARGPATADLVDSLPVVPGSAPLRRITDASLAPDAKHLAVRTYSQVYLFATDSATGRVRHDVAPSVCNLVVLAEPQGEGVTWADADGRLVFTSEGQKEPVRLATCPPPAP